MTPKEAACGGVGFLLGLACWFPQVDAPKASSASGEDDACGVYRVQKRIATSYVLVPPAPGRIFCEAPITPKPDKAPDVLAKAETPDVSAERVEEPDTTAREPRRRHRHHHRHRYRYRRYW